MPNINLSIVCYNVVYLIGAVILIFIGASGLWGNFDNFSQVEDDVVQLYLTFGEGCIMVITGIIGCCALLGQSACMCITYATLQLGILAANGYLLFDINTTDYEQQLEEVLTELKDDAFRIVSDIALGLSAILNIIGLFITAYLLWTKKGAIAGGAISGLV